MADIGQTSVPSKNLGIVNKKNSVLQGSKQEFSNLSRKTQESDHQCNRRDDRRFMPRRSCRYRRDKTWHPQIRDWNKIHSLRSSDGHVPRRSTSFLDHANRKMVKHSLPQINSKASTGVFARHLLENDRSSFFQTRPKPNRNEPGGEHSWQLVFVADGLNWWRKHHRRKDGGGDEPINNWSQPQPSSKLHIWYLVIPCTHLVHFSVFVTGGRISARWTPSAEDTLFFLVFTKGN
jgi:hypothetical protein